MATLTITHADGSTETYTIDRTKFEGVRTMTVDGSPVSVDRTPASEIRTLLLNGETVEIQRNTEGVRSLTIDGVPVSIDRSDEVEVLSFVEEFGQPAVAYSLRKLNSAYTGPAVRIRRTSDNVEVNVSFDTNDEVSESSAITNLNPSNLPSGITSFTISGTTDNTSGDYTTDGTLFNGKLFYKKTGASDEQVRYDGSKWLLWDNDEGEAYYVADGDTELPWDVQHWEVGSGNGGTPVFSNFVGPDSGDTTATTLGEFLTEGGIRSAAVHTWYDQSGNSRNATQISATEQPLIADNGNYLGELSFDGSNHTLNVVTISTLGIDGSNNKSVFAVARTTAGTDGFVIAGTSGGTNFRGLRYRSSASNGLARVEVSGFGFQGGDLSDGNNHVYSSIFNGTQTGDFDVSLDGSITQASGTNAIDTDGTATFSVGTATSNANAGFTREFILYASDQNANRTAIENNIANAHGITLS